MMKILQYLEDPKLWELWYIPYYGSFRVDPEVLFGASSLPFRRIPIGSTVVPFYGLYLESYKVIPKKELLRGPWVTLTSA